MPVDVTPCEQNADVKVVLLSGRLDMADAEAVRETMKQALADSAAGIVVDMGALGFISSSGLRTLISVQKEAAAAAKQVALVAAQPPVHKIFKIAGLDSVFCFFENAADALKGLWG